MSDFLHTVERLAESWDERLWQASWQGAVVLAVVCVFARWCTFVSPRVICWVLRLACLKLVVTLFWVGGDLSAAAARDASRIFLRGTCQTNDSAARRGKEPRIVESFEPASQIRPQPLTAMLRIDQLPLLQTLWLVGCCGCVMITIRHWITIHELCRAADPVCGAVLQNAFRLEAQRLRIRRLPGLRLSPRVDGPLLAGIRRPTIILPDRVEESFDESEVRLMLAHELAHLKRRDLLWNWLPTIVGWLFWFHPMVWLMSAAGAKPRKRPAMRS